MARADAVSVILSIDHVGRVAILNFSDYLEPGGLSQGARTQEESLCLEPTLYPVLASNRKTFYDKNIDNASYNDGLYQNRALYTPSIIFERGDIIKEADVITCAAPNLNAYKKDASVNYKVLASRINFIMNIAEYEGVDSLILGAYGCGVFGQNPNHVAKLFKKELAGRNIQQVIFAMIPGHNEAVFKTVFSTY